MRKNKRHEADVQMLVGLLYASPRHWVTVIKAVRAFINPDRTRKRRGKKSKYFSGTRIETNQVKTGYL